MIIIQTISCILIFLSVGTTFSQNFTTSEKNITGIVKIIKDDQIVAKSFKQGTVYTIEYLNQLDPHLKSYASFSFNEQGDTTVKIYRLVSRKFKERSLQPVSFTTPSGIIRFEYGLTEADSIVVRLAQYNLQEILQAHSLYFNRSDLNSLFDQ